MDAGKHQARMDTGIEDGINSFIKMNLKEIHAVFFYHFSTNFQSMKMHCVMYVFPIVDVEINSSVHLFIQITVHTTLRQSKRYKGSS